MPPVKRDTSARKLFTWSLWSRIEKTWFWFYPHAKRKQAERWHLRGFQTKRRVVQLAKWLASSLSHRCSNVEVRIESIWVDHTPQAEADYLDHASATKLRGHCELADLLLIVEVTARRPGGPMPLSRRALLVQAKVSDRTDELDASPDASTTAERNLLECCIGAITVRSGTHASSHQLRNSPYSIVQPGNVGLADYARYQLTPRARPALPLSPPPYRTLWPTTRASSSGSISDFDSVLLEMTGLMPTSAGADLIAPANKGWSDLVHDLLNDYQGIQVKRFKKATGTTIPRVVDSGNWYLRATPRDILESSWAGRWLQSLMHRFPIVPVALFALDPQQHRRFDGHPEVPSDDERGGQPHISTMIVTVQADIAYDGAA